MLSFLQVDTKVNQHIIINETADSFRELEDAHHALNRA